MLSAEGNHLIPWMAALIFLFGTTPLVRCVDDDPCDSDVLILKHHEYRNEDHSTTGETLCDMDLIVPGNWYRVSPNDSETMATSCPGMYQCGTMHPIWINGSHPTEYGTPVWMTLFMHISQNCTYWPPGAPQSVLVRRCAGQSGGFYYIYQLPNPTICPTAFCTHTNSDLLKDGTTNSGINPVIANTTSKPAIGHTSPELTTARRLTTSGINTITSTIPTTNEMGGERGKAGDSDAVRAGLKSGTSLALVIGLVLTGLVLIVLIIVVVIVCSRNRRRASEKKAPIVSDTAQPNVYSVKGELQYNDTVTSLGSLGTTWDDASTPDDDTYLKPRLPSTPSVTDSGCGSEHYLPRDPPPPSYHTYEGLQGTQEASHYEVI